MEGNGRTARLVANLILERYGLVGISVKIEKENKNEYRKSLAQIDKYGDYEPLEEIISEGIIERYHGVSMKYYKV
jgi:Fic family protein